MLLRDITFYDPTGGNTESSSGTCLFEHACCTSVLIRRSTMSFHNLYLLGKDRSKK